VTTWSRGLQAARLTLSALLAVGCVVPADVLEDRPCPCAPGHHCGPSGVCLPGDAPDAGRPDDAGRDGGPADGGLTDAGRDAGRDGGAPDAGPAGPVASYACEALDGAFVRDVSGAARDGRCDAAGCPDVVAGRVGNGCDFTAESRRLRVSYDPVFVPDVPPGSGVDFSVALWLYLHDPAPETVRSQSAIGLPAGSGSANVWQLFLNASSGAPRPGFITTNDVEIRSVYATDPLTLERWTHVALVYAGGDKLVYVDGVEVARAEGETVIPSNQDVLIGADENDGSRLVFPLDGVLDEIHVFDRALSRDEVAALARGE